MGALGVFTVRVRLLPSHSKHLAAIGDNFTLRLAMTLRKDGTADPFSSGTYIDAQGKAQHLGVSDFAMQLQAQA